MPTRWANSPNDTCTHRIYGLTCEVYDALAERAAGQCEFCGREWSPADRVRPQVDHDHTVSQTAVRGLVCAKCNAHMRRVDSGERPIDEPTQAYLARAWHLTNGAEAGTVHD